MFGWITRWFGRSRARKAAHQDVKIQREVKRRFQADPYLGERNLRVMVKNGIVTLTGTVTSPLQKELAEEIALRVPGASQVQDNLELGIGRPVVDDQQENISPGDVIVTRTVDTGRVALDPPDAPPAHEDQPRSRFEEAGVIESGVAVRNTLQPIPLTGASSSMAAIDPQQVTREERGESTDRNIALGMEVVDPRGRHVGVVKAIRPTGFLLERSLAPDLVVPYPVSSCDGRLVTLKVAEDQVDSQGWAHA